MSTNIPVSFGKVKFSNENLSFKCKAKKNIKNFTSRGFFYLSLNAIRFYHQPHDGCTGGFTFIFVIKNNVFKNIALWHAYKRSRHLVTLN